MTLTLVDYGKSQQATLSSNLVPSMVEKSGEASISQFQCPLCPKLCKNKGALASHLKACALKNDPSTRKSQRRLSKSLHLMSDSTKDHEKRLRTGII